MLTLKSTFVEKLKKIQTKNDAFLWPTTVLSWRKHKHKLRDSFVMLLVRWTIDGKLNGTWIAAVRQMRTSARESFSIFSLRFLFCVFSNKTKLDCLLVLQLVQCVRVRREMRMRQNEINWTMCNLCSVQSVVWRACVSVSLMNNHIICYCLQFSFSSSFLFVSF